MDTSNTYIKSVKGTDCKWLQDDVIDVVCITIKK